MKVIGDFAGAGVINGGGEILIGVALRKNWRQSGGNSLMVFAVSGNKEMGGRW